MTTKTLVLAPEDFFHARPAALISAAAKPFQSMVMVALGDDLADAKDPFALMRLKHPMGQPFDLFADGADEAAALDAVEAAIRNVFSVADVV